MHLKTLTVTSLMCLAYIGCGGSDEEDTGGASGSYADIADSIANPTGTLSEGNVNDVAAEYEAMGGGSFGGLRQQAAGSGQQTVEQACPSGGMYSVTASGSQSGGTADISYDQCCYAAECCYDGGGHYYYSSEGAGAYSFCGDFSLSLECGGTTGSSNFSGCMGAGGWTYVVTVGGQTFAVSGSLQDGNGNLTITGSNGEFTCSWSGGSGSCSGSSGSFEF